jgi:hypothetical protein
MTPAVNPCSSTLRPTVTTITSATESAAAGQSVRVQVLDGDRPDQNRGQSARSDPAEEQRLAGAETGSHQGQRQRHHADERE